MKKMNMDDLLIDMGARNEVYDSLSKGNEIEKIFAEFALKNGTTFEMILPGYMTWKQYGALYNITNDAARKYTRDDIDMRSELIEDGMKRYSVAEFESLKNQIFSEATESRFRKLYENNKINNKGEYLFPLKAVHKVGSTIKPKEYRNFVYDKLSQSVVLEEAVKEQNEKTLTFILEMADQGEVISTDKLFDVIECMSKTTALNTLTGINKAIDDIKRIKVSYEKLKDDLKTQLEKGTVPPGSKLRVKAKIDNIGTLIYNLGEIKDSYKDIRDNYKDQLFNRVKTIASINLTDIICERDEECKQLQELGKSGRIKLNALINEYKEALVDEGVLYKEEYIKNEGKVNEKGKSIESKGYNYLPTKDYAWIGESTVGCFSRTQTSQIIKLSEYGVICFNYMFDMIESEEGFVHFKEEDFKDYLVSIN